MAQGPGVAQGLWTRHKVIVCLFPFFISQALSLLFPEQSTPSHTSCSAPTTLMPTVHSEQTRAPLQVRSIGSMADIDAPTGYEPKQFTEQSTIDFSQSFFHGLDLNIRLLQKASRRYLWIWRSTMSNQRNRWLHHCFQRSKCMQTHLMFITSKRKLGIRLFQNSNQHRD